MGSVVKLLRRSALVDGRRISYEDAGSGSPAVILIHGTFEDSTYFAPQLRHLADRHRVIALDLPAHGQSDVASPLDVEGFTRDVVTVCAEAGVERAVLCGHSILGAAIALAVAAARPDLVHGVAILDAVLFPPSAWRQSLESLLPALDGDHWTKAIQGYFARTLDANDPPELAARVMDDIALHSRDSVRSLVASFLAVDIGEAMKDASCPLLYVHAKAPADLQRLGQLRPDAFIGQVVGSGHYLMLVVPDQVNAMLDRFLELIEPGQEAHS